MVKPRLRDCVLTPVLVCRNVCPCHGIEPRVGSCSVRRCCLFAEMTRQMLFFQSRHLLQRPGIYEGGLRRPPFLRRARDARKVVPLPGRYIQALFFELRRCPLRQTRPLLEFMLEVGLIARNLRLIRRPLRILRTSLHHHGRPQATVEKSGLTATFFVFCICPSKSHVYCTRKCFNFCAWSSWRSSGEGVGSGKWSIVAVRHCCRHSRD